MRIELHADDLGASENVNRNIIEAWLADGINGVSVIANGDAISEAAAAVKANKEKSLRLVAHLNLSEGLPTLSPSSVPSLVCRSGRLNVGFLGIWIKWLLSDKNTQKSITHQIENEWRAQIKKIIDLFCPLEISGIDGHIHIHMLPFLFPIACRLAKEFKLPEIRISSEQLHYCSIKKIKFGIFANIIKHALLNLLSVYAKKSIRNYRIKSPCSVAGILYSGFMSSSAAESAIKKAHRKNISWLEIIFHPGKATLNEAHRWPKNSAIGKFYLDRQRDCERNVLLGIKKQLSHLL
jgi:predicted glycoside hydrolase/deacetylase ChbG (UPF0249 family)